MNKWLAIASTFLLAIVFAGCENTPDNNQTIAVTENGSQKYFGKIGTDTIYAFTISNGRGLKAVVSNYGATLLSLWVPDKSGKSGNIILGYDSLSGYLQKTNPYFGAIVGRYANRISQARFSLKGKTYTLAANDKGNTLHGGLKGFDKVVWTIDQVNDSSLSLSYSSPDGEEGFPGNLTVKVIYTFRGNNSLDIDYYAITDQETPVNLTNHAYFNLSSGLDSTILGEELQLFASQFTPVNDSLIPTGQRETVRKTPFDFLNPKKVGKEIDKLKGGYDHNFVIDKTDSSFSHAATLTDPASGRIMEVWTTQPGIQFYSGNFLDGTLMGNDGKRIQQHGALCLETQHFPDSPNQPGFPNTILQPGQTYHEHTVYRFLVKS